MYDARNLSENPNNVNALLRYHIRQTFAWVVRITAGNKIWSSGRIFMRFGVSLLVLVFAIPLNAQNKVFKWPTELCMVTGSYDSKKYTEAQLRDTLVLFPAAVPRLEFDAAVFRYEEIAKLDIATLDREYAEKSRILRSLNIVKTPFWEQLRRAALEEMEQVYQLKKITAQAYTRPEAITEYPRAESCKMKFGGPLIDGGESLIGIWRQVNLDSQKRNADPKRLQQRFDSENASPDRLKFALVETKAFGWWNCANETIDRPEYARDGTVEKEFRKLFTRVKEVRDEP